MFILRPLPSLAERLGYTTAEVADANMFSLRQQISYPTETDAW
jgi:hypothetical protein